MSKVYPLKCRVVRNEGSDVTRVDVYDDIGGGGWFSYGLTAKDFAAEMAGISGDIDCHINSGGGDVFDGIAIANALRAHKGKVTTIVDGIAASIASVIAQAAQERVVEPGSMLMIHEAFSYCAGDARDMAKEAEILDKVSGNIADIYAERGGGTPESWRDAMREETWYTADEAVTAGLADRVGAGKAELPAGLDLAAFTSVPGRIAARLREMPVMRAAGAAPAKPKAAAGTHPPFDGTHSHSHSAYGDSDGDGDGTHSHEHDHDGDADHDHPHGDDASAHAESPPVAGDQHREAIAHQCCKDAASARDLLRGLVRDEVASQAPASEGRAVTLGDVRAIVREELHVANAAADESAWDGPAAMSWASSQDDPEAALRAICAGEKTTGEPDTQDHWALPHHRHSGDAPNRAGVSAALGRLDQAQDLKSKSAAEDHLRAHQSAMGDGDDDGAEDHAETDLSGFDLDEFRAGLKGATA